MPVESVRPGSKGWFHSMRDSISFWCAGLFREVLKPTVERNGLQPGCGAWVHAQWFVMVSPIRVLQKAGVVPCGYSFLKLVAFLECQERDEVFVPWFAVALHAGIHGLVPLQ